MEQLIKHLSLIKQPDGTFTGLHNLKAVIDGNDLRFYNEKGFSCWVTMYMIERSVEWAYKCILMMIRRNESKGIK